MELGGALAAAPHRVQLALTEQVVPPAARGKVDGLPATAGTSSREAHKTTAKAGTVSEEQ